MVTADIAISVDGYAAGPNQSLENPLGEGDLQLHVAPVLLSAGGTCSRRSAETQRPSPTAG